VPLARSVDVLSQEPGSVGDSHVAAEFIDVHYVGPARAQHHIHPVEIDAEGTPAAPGDVSELTGDGKRFTDLILVSAEWPDPPHPEELTPNAKDLVIRSIRLHVALRQDRLVCREIGQLADLPDDADAFPARSPIGLD